MTAGGVNVETILEQVCHVLICSGLSSCTKDAYHTT